MRKLHLSSVSIKIRNFYISFTYICTLATFTRSLRMFPLFDFLTIVTPTTQNDYTAVTRNRIYLESIGLETHNQRHLPHGLGKINK